MVLTTSGSGWIWHWVLNGLRDTQPLGSQDPPSALSQRFRADFHELPLSRPEMVCVQIKQADDLSLKGGELQQGHRYQGLTLEEEWSRKSSKRPTTRSNPDVCRPGPRLGSVAHLRGEGWASWAARPGRRIPRPARNWSSGGAADRWFTSSRLAGWMERLAPAAKETCWRGLPA